MSNDKIDDLLAIGAAFDWISPTWAFLQDFANGSPADFGIPSNAGWDRGDIKRLLSKNGVRVWGLMLNLSGDMLLFTVSQTQARYTYYILQREAAPILYAPNEVTPDEAAKPSVALGNSFHTGKMEIVEAPSIWKWIGRLLARKGTQ